jgi:hypothetical protein
MIGLGRIHRTSVARWLPGRSFNIYLSNHDKYSPIQPALALPQDDRTGIR